MKSSRQSRGRVVVVTGGTRGLGRIIAGAFVRAGDRVWVLARRPVLWTGKARPRFLSVDVTCAGETMDAAELIKAQAGPVSVWINNAGGGGRVPFEGDDVAWRQGFEQNFLGAVNGCRAALSVRAPRLSLVNIASLAGLMSPAGHSAYATAKAAVMALSRSLAVEYAKRGVRVNAVAPGPMATPGFRAAGGQARARARGLPTGKLVSPAEVARACLWLSEPVNALTGHTLVVDGGASAAGCYVPTV